MTCLLDFVKDVDASKNSAEKAEPRSAFLTDKDFKLAHKIFFEEEHTNVTFLSKADFENGQKFGANELYHQGSLIFTEFKNNTQSTLKFIFHTYHFNINF